MISQATQSPNAQRPRDAATLIIVDRDRTPPRVFMGRRRPDQIFMPDKYVFPGGRLDKSDRHIKPSGDLAEVDLLNLQVDMKGRSSPERARTLALTAIRETYEETGLLIASTPAPPASPPPASSNPAWQKIFETGLIPCLTGITFLARAITPPGRSRRYDTRFFCVDAARVSRTDSPLDQELLDQNWFAIDELRMLDLAHITRVIVEDLDERLRQNCSDTGAATPPVPYYFYANGAFERQLIQSGTHRS